jgi:hypothetical protein
MNGATSVPDSTVATPFLTSSDRAASRNPSTMLTAYKITKTITSVPNTCQPRPRTSSWLRPKDASAPDRSITMTGTITAQMVIRYRPGAISKASPIVMAMPARIDAAATGRIDGAAAGKISRSDRFARPSRMSWTALTSAAWTRNAASRLMMEPSSVTSSPPATETIPSRIAAAT